MTSAQALMDQEIEPFGWMESIATNSISDFKSPKSNVLEQATDKNNSDIIETFIFHLIFYVISCYSLFLYVVIDLGLGLLIKNKITVLIKSQQKHEMRHAHKPTISN